MKRKLKQRLRLARFIIYKETLLDAKEHLWTFLGSFVGISLIGALHGHALGTLDSVFLIGSFGASSVLLYGVINSPFSQPRNLVGGHLLSALVGVTVQRVIPGQMWLAAGLTVSTTIVLMQITKTLHPPGGATALIAVIGSERIRGLGYFYVLSPVLTGVAILLATALVFNNATAHRRYPLNPNWYRIWQRRYLG
jgi:CBS-domain-containing membrane protein